MQSYVDTLDFGLVSCRELVPDLWDLVGFCVDEVDVLCRAAGVERVRPATTTKPRAKRAAPKKAAPRKQKAQA